MPIGRPGWPEFAASTASIAKARMTSAMRRFSVIGRARISACSASALVGAEAAQIATNTEIYVELDLAYARAAVAERMNAIAPELVAEATLDIFEGRHPLLDARAVPQSIRRRMK